MWAGDIFWVNKHRIDNLKKKKSYKVIDDMLKGEIGTEIEESLQLDSDANSVKKKKKKISRRICVPKEGI